MYSSRARGSSRGREAAAMKRRGLIIWLLGLSLWASAGAVESGKAFGIIYVEREGRLSELESFRPNLIRQPDLRGYSREFLQIPELASKARFQQGTPLSWSVRYRVQPPDPFLITVQQLDLMGFQLHALKVESANRILMLSEANPYRETHHSGLPLKVTPVGRDVLRLESARELTPGEYALVYQPREAGAQVFCFAVDAVQEKP